MTTNNPKKKQKPLNRRTRYCGYFLIVSVVLPIFMCCGYITIMMSYLIVADAWGASFEADVYPNSELVYEYWRGGSGSTYNYFWYCTTDSIGDVANFYLDYGYEQIDSPTRQNYHRGSKSTDNSLARLFTSIGTGWTDYPPDASLAFWSITDESTEVDRERCPEGVVIIEIGSGYAD